MTTDIIMLCIVVGSIIAQAGGFLYVTRNHLRHIQESLDRIENRVFLHGERIAYLEGEARRHGRIIPED